MCNRMLLHPLPGGSAVFSCRFYITLLQKSQAAEQVCSAALFLLFGPLHHGISAEGFIVNIHIGQILLAGAGIQSEAVFRDRLQILPRLCGVLLHRHTVPAGGQHSVPLPIVLLRHLKLARHTNRRTIHFSAGKVDFVGNGLVAAGLCCITYFPCCLQWFTPVCPLRRRTRCRCNNGCCGPSSSGISSHRKRGWRECGGPAVPSPARRWWQARR